MNSSVSNLRCRVVIEFTRWDVICQADAWFDVADPCFLRPETCDPGFAKFLQFRWLQDLRDLGWSNLGDLAEWSCDGHVPPLFWDMKSIEIPYRSLSQM